MSAERQKNQLAFSFAGGSEAPLSEGEGTEALRARRETEDPAGNQRVMEEVCEPENWREAWQRVRANQGSPGIDGMTVDELPEYLEQHWPAIREQLLSGTYEPKPVKRVEIPKPDGGVRKLGIPTVLDRFVQQAVQQVLQKQWDPTFSEHSYGFRPGRSAQQAVARAQQYIAEGYGWCVDFDLEKFFDRVNHDKLMGQIAKRVEDKRLLKLIRAFLNAGVMENGLVSPSVEGTPDQGRRSRPALSRDKDSMGLYLRASGPLSPLLSNLVLDELDRELERRGHRFVRYADDSNIYVRSERAGQRVMESVKRFITEKLKLKVNESKSAVAKPQERKFLGFSFTSGRELKRKIAPKAIHRFKERVREITAKSKGRSMEQVMEELAKYLRGWRAYFGFCETPSVLQRLDAWIRRRLRGAFWRQWKTGRKRYAELIRRGVSAEAAAKTAGSRCGPWHVSQSPALDRALSNAYLASLGLPSLLEGR
jgi:RNA-directed DNA polymerase